MLSRNLELYNNSSSAAATTNVSMLRGDTDSSNKPTADRPGTTNEISHFFFFFTITVDAHSIDRRNMAPSPLSLAQGGIFLFAENSFHLNTTRKLPCVIKRKICIKRKRGGGGGTF